MKMRQAGTFGSLVLMVLISAGMVQGQSPLTGAWEGETDGGASLRLDFTVKGTALTGTLTRNQQETPLSEGKVSKNTFTFKTTLNERAEGFSGEVEGDRMRIWLDRQGPEKAIVLTRVKGK